MNVVLIGIIFLVINLLFSLTIALIIIHRLYVSKKFSKENDFHLYNDLFSWEMFFISIGISNIFTILNLTIRINSIISNIFINIVISLLFFSFWNKIIHLEKIMEKITYEKHHIVVGIPFILMLFMIILNLPNFMLVFIFLGVAFIPYLTLILLWRKTGDFQKDYIKIVIGATFIAVGGFLMSNVINLFLRIEEILNILMLIVPFMYILGTLIIFLSFQKYLFN